MSSIILFTNYLINYTLVCTPYNSIIRTTELFCLQIYDFSLQIVAHFIGKFIILLAFFLILDEFVAYLYERLLFFHYK